MTDAPERIWTSKNGKQIVSADMNQWPTDVQYVRADLYDAAIARAEKAEAELAMARTNTVIDAVSDEKWLSAVKCLLLKQTLNMR